MTADFFTGEGWLAPPSPPRKKGGDMSANCNKIHDNQVIPNQEARADDVATHWSFALHLELHAGLAARAI